MDNQELRQLLQQLHKEIEHTESVDEKGRALLQELASDIRTLLERSASEQTRPQPATLQTLEDTINHLEITHPTLTITLSKVLEGLSNAGI